MGLLLVILVAGCGRGDDDPGPQHVRGFGYSFSAPGTWEVTRSGRTTSAGADDGAAVSVTRFGLDAAYEPRLAAQVTAELDRVAGALADKLGGGLGRRTRPRIGGRAGWAYELSGARDGTRRIGFVLVGRSEYQLLCRWREEDGEEPCRMLFASFRLD